MAENNELTFNTNGFKEGLDKLKNIATDGIKDIAKDVMSGIASICSAAINQIADVVKENLSVDMAGLNSALEGTGIAIYEEIRDPMRETIQEITGYVNELTNKIADGELSGSFEIIAAGISDVASSLASVSIENVLPALIDSAAWFIDNGQTLIAIITGIATAVVSYVGITSTALISNITIAEGIIFLEEVIRIAAGKIVDSIMAIKAAINPMALIFAAFTAAVVAGSFALKNYIDNAAIDDIGNVAIANIDNKIKAIKEQQKAFEELKEAQEEKISYDEIETNNIQKLWSELQKYVNTSGEVLENDERVSEIIGTLNSAYGMNIECINGQIQGYQDLADSMDDYIANLRLEAKARNLQPVYDEAIQKQEEYYNRRAELEEQLNKKIEAFNVADNNDVKGVFAVQIAALREEILALDESAEIYKEAIDEFEGIFAEKYLKADPYAGKSNEEINREKYIQGRIEEAQAQAKEQEDNTRKLQNAWSKLDHEYAMGAITSDEDLYSARLNLLNKFGDESNSEHWRYYEQLHKQKQDSAEKRKKDIEDAEKEAAEAQKKEIQDKWDTISKQEKLGLISSEEAYRQQLALIEQYCPEYADEWYSYYQTILDYQRDALREQVQGVKDNLSDIIGEYQTEFSKIESMADSYKNKLLSVGSVFTVTTETDDDGNESKSYNIEDMTGQMEKMKKYHDLIKSLKDRGVSSEVLSELTALDMDEGMTFAENLAMSSDADLEKITALYAERDKLAEDLANELYAPEMDKLNDDLITGITDQFGTLPAEIRAIGGQSLAAFIEGILDDKANLSDAAQEFMDSFFTACDEGISSGSIGMENVGENIAAALGEQDTYSIGFENGKKLVEGFNEAISTLNNKLMAGNAEMSAGLVVTARQEGAVNYGSSSFSNSSSKNERIVFENREQVTVKIDKEVLGKTMREYTREYERRTNT